MLELGTINERNLERTAICESADRRIVASFYGQKQSVLSNGFDRAWLSVCWRLGSRFDVNFHVR